MTGFTAVLWQEWLIFKRKWLLTTMSALVTPLLYLVAFGWGMASHVGNSNYFAFMLPGLLGMISMLSSYNASSHQVSISIIFYDTFEAMMIAPIRTSAYVFAKIVAGALQGLYIVSVMIVVAHISGIRAISWYSLLILILNSLVFAAIGVLVALSFTSYHALAKFSNFIITPMSFLCGTFFDVDRLSIYLRALIWVLPLTHTNQALRLTDITSLAALIHVLVLAAALVACASCAIWRCGKCE